MKSALKSKFCRAAIRVGVSEEEALRQAMAMWLAANSKTEKTSTLKDLSRASGFSVMSCHYAMRYDDGFVSDDTRMKIRSTAKKIAFAFNVNAVNVRKQRNIKRFQADVSASSGC